MVQTPFRAPAYPLITIDPYTSIWSMGDRLNGDTTRHWSGRPNSMLGTAEIDGNAFRFMGPALGTAAMTQTGVTFDSFSTVYTFQAGGVELTAHFTSPVLPDDMRLSSRPVSYLRLAVKSIDDTAHTVKVTVEATSQLCLNDGRQCPVLTEKVDLGKTLTSIKMGGQEQAMLGKCGDGICIDWGWFFLTAGHGTAYRGKADDLPAVGITSELNTAGTNSVLFLFAYDDIHSITYFGKPLNAWWSHEGASIEGEIVNAFWNYEKIMERCRAFDARMYSEAEKAGGRQYAELLQLALRQVMAAHKLVADEDGQPLFISKECFSNGCAATVDVSYPSVPLFLLYNPELIKGMMRPIFRYAEGKQWPFDFAPHDAGTYPILNGQVYSEGTAPDWQMPVEECGNMLIMAAAVSRAEGNADFAAHHRKALKTWADYLLKNGVDPENQLCTDDFAGHLAHNCNLSVKAIMGIASYAILCRYWKDETEAERYMAAARDMAVEWTRNAANDDKSTRLAFDQPGTVSMKYNAVWDILFGTELFSKEVIQSETGHYLNRMNPYGLPLDNRADYTKSDWLVWSAAMCDSKEAFAEMVAPLYRAYASSPSRVPMTDWYSTVTSLQCGFQHRSVQGGLWIRVLEQSGVMRGWGYRK